MKNEAPSFHLVQIYDIDEQRLLLDWTCKECKKKFDCQKYFIKQDKCYVAKKINSSENFNIIANANTFFNNIFFIRFNETYTEKSAHRKICKIFRLFYER